MQGQAEREVVAAHAAELLGERQPEQPELAHLRDDLVGELASLVVVADHGRDHAGGKVPDRGAEVLVLVVEHEADHGVIMRPATRPGRWAGYALVRAVHHREAITRGTSWRPRPAPLAVPRPGRMI